jgi:hypothetical protein
VWLDAALVVQQSGHGFAGKNFQPDDHCNGAWGLMLLYICINIGVFAVGQAHALPLVEVAGPCAFRRGIKPIATPQSQFVNQSNWMFDLLFGAA